MITTPILIAETLAIIILAVALAHNPNQYPTLKEHTSHG